MPAIPTQIIKSVMRSELSSSIIEREFRRLLPESKLVVSGSARRNPELLFERGLRPKHRIDLFDKIIYLTNIRQVPELRFFVAYVVENTSKATGRSRSKIYPRIFYKDLSLAWRSASHFSQTDEGIWVGKGDVRPEFEDGEEFLTSIESTTDLPFELQNALDQTSKLTKKPKGKESTLELILRRSPVNRVQPYRDFTEPRRKASAFKANLINGGKSIATFTRANDPKSLKFVAGFKPDFKNGIIETTESKSKLYHGKLRRFRILSRNQKIQYYFFSGPKHVWIIPPQATTTELSSYCVRTIDVIADDNLFIPGYEYHHMEETNSGELELYSQIPAGFAGEVCEHDDAKADASPWLDKIPLINQFRREVLG